MRGGKLKRKLAGDQPVFGPFVMLPAPGLVEIAGLFGFDFVLLDMEHGPHSIEALEHMVRAADTVALPALVRVPENTPGWVTRALDTGAAGVCVPHVSTAADAEAAVRAAKFAPLGRRGVNAASRAARYASLHPKDYFFRAGEEVLLLAQVEDREGVRSICDILDIEGIDVVFIGPYDLSQSCGVPGELDSPELQRLMLVVVRQCRAREMVVGTFEADPDRLAEWVREGVRLFAVGTDISLFAEACQRLANRARHTTERVAGRTP